VGALAGQQQGANELGQRNKSEPLDFLRSAISAEGNWYCGLLRRGVNTPPKYVPLPTITDVDSRSTASPMAALEMHAR
jgi:hypothetical protein